MSFLRFSILALCVRLTRAETWIPNCGDTVDALERAYGESIEEAFMLSNDGTDPEFILACSTYLVPSAQVSPPFRWSSKTLVEDGKTNCPVTPAQTPMPASPEQTPLPASPAKTPVPATSPESSHIECDGPEPLEPPTEMDQPCANAIELYCQDGLTLEPLNGLSSSFSYHERLLNPLRVESFEFSASLDPKEEYSFSLPASECRGVFTKLIAKCPKTGGTYYDYEPYRKAVWVMHRSESSSQLSEPSE